MSTAAATPTDDRGFVSFLKSSIQQLFVFAALIVVFIFFMVSANNFTPGVVIPQILLQAAAIGTMALGATFIIATGGIDLSVGTGMTFCAVMAGVFMSSTFMNLPLGLGLLLTLGVGALIGLVNGVLVAYLEIPPFIATLAMMMVTRGLSLIISNASSIRIENPDYSFIANGRIIPGVPVSNAALIFILLGVISAVVLGKTLLGRYALAVGSNEEATRLSGVNVRVWKMLVYIFAGLFTAIGAILYSGRFGFVQPAEGLGMELQVIAAVVIGGTSLAGGRANIVGTMMGALLMMTLTVGLQMMGVQQQWQLVVTGIVVVIAVFADILRRKRADAV